MQILNQAQKHEDQKKVKSLLDKSAGSLRSNLKITINTNTIVNVIYAILFGLLPIIFVPALADPFGFVRSYLIVFVSLLGLILVIIDRLIKGRLYLLDQKNYLPIYAFLLAVIASVSMSLNKAVSIFGAYGNNESTLIYFVAVVLIMFTASISRISYKRLADVLVASTTITTVVSLGFYFGLLQRLIGQGIKEFSLIGSPDRLFSLQLIVITICVFNLLSKAVNTNLRKNTVIGFYSLAFLINVFYLSIGLNVYTLIAFVVIYVVVIYFIKLSEIAKYNLYLNLALLAVSVSFFITFNIPIIRRTSGISNYAQELRLPVKESWEVAASSLRDYPLFGTGLGNYFKNYTIYRPLSVNDTSYWELRFLKPFNDLFIWISCAGLVGLALYSSFWLLIIKRAITVKKDSKSVEEAAIIVIISSVLMLLLSMNIITYAVLAISVGFILNRTESKLSVIKLRPFIGSLLVLFVGITIYLGIRIYPLWMAQVYYRKSLSTDNAVSKYNFQRTAMAYDNLEVTYRADNVLTSLFIAKQLSNTPNLSEGDKEQVIGLIKQAVDDSLVLTEIIDPYNVAVWELRGLVYSSISDVVTNANAHAVNAYQKAIALESNNPKLYVTLGGLYYKYNSFQDAALAFNKAVILKPNYANARYNLAHTLAKLGDLQNAIVQLETVESLVAKDSVDFKTASKDLQEFKDIYQKMVDKANKETKKIEADMQSDSIAKDSNIMIDKSKQEPLSDIKSTQPVISNTSVGTTIQESK